MSFKPLGLSDALIKAINHVGYTEPTPIQVKAIPQILNRKDILASAQTGTGKTAAFALPMLQLLMREQPRKRRPIRALVLTPTRELAAQVHADIKSYSKFSEMRSTVIFGGVKQAKQVVELDKGVDVLIATPGRLLDLNNQGIVSLSQIEILVLDEADRMLDMGFLRDIKRIIGLMPDRRQNLLFSATFSKEIKKLANGLLQQPVTVEATPENTTAELVNQKIIRVDQKRKTELITKLIWDGNWHQVLVFTRTKHGANRLSGKLEKSKISSAAIHGNKTQSARTKALAAFKRGDVSVLVATDIAARGLDIPLLPHVINYELPNVPEDYVHRIGRTGRAGVKGEALSLVSSDEVAYMRAIEKLLGRQLESEVIEGFEPSKGPVQGGKKRVKAENARNQNESSQGHNKNHNHRRRPKSNSKRNHNKNSNYKGANRRNR
jgi:ATP-dependent RNA helicase RhlE